MYVCVCVCVAGCLHVCACVSMYLYVCAPDQNDLKLDTVVVLDTVSQPTDFGFKMTRVRVRV